ncbi:MAG: transaldolase [Nitrospiraceae bacterium]|nr:transaldolase [Nitrospiraceae bacterium]
MADMQKVQEITQALAIEGVDYEPGKPGGDVPTDAEWQKVRATGTQLWLDTGDLDEATRLFTAEFQALTTNNTLLNNEVQKGIYDDLVGQVAARIREAAPDITDKELLLEIAFVLNAHHGLRLVQQFDAFVSVELHTDVANDPARSVAYGKRFHAICPERFIVKVPLTPSGFLAARALGQAGIPINFTLGFSARQNCVAAVLSRPAYVNVFMGRLGAFLADNGLGSGDCIGEKATLATQRELIALRAAGRSESKLIGASMRKAAQVADLAGLDVFTMPLKVAEGHRAAAPAEVSVHVQDDPEVPLADGVNLSDFAGEGLWEVPDALKAAVDELAAMDAGTLTPDALVAHFEQAGFGGLFPRWTEEQLAMIAADGKIPVFATWKELLTSGAVGLDALMNAAALCSFTTDQAALDNRIASLLKTQ